MLKRVCQRWAAAAAVSMGAMMATTALAQSANPLVLVVSEGAASDTHRLAAQTRYQGMADLLSQATRMPVVVQERARLSDVDEGIRKGEFDFVFVRPADVAARAMRDHQFRYVANGKPDSFCMVGVTKDSPIQKLADIQGKRIATLENPKAYLIRFCAADLRDQGIDLAKQKVQGVSLQGAVGVAVSSGMADVGLFEIRGAEQWQKQGHRIIHTSVPQPYFPLVASPRITPEQIQAVRQALRAPANQAVLRELGMQSVDTSMEAQLQKLLPWLQGQ